MLLCWLYLSAWSLANRTFAFAGTAFAKSPDQDICYPCAATPRWAEELLQRPETVRPAASPALTVPAALEGALQAAAGAALGAEVTLVKGGGTPGRPAQRGMIALQLLPQGGSGDWQICAPYNVLLGVLLTPSSLMCVRLLAHVLRRAMPLQAP